MRFKFSGIIAIVTLALSFAGCNQPTNDNANANANSRAVVTNENTNAKANANTNTKRAPTREEYEKNKQSYSQQAKNLGQKIGTGLDDGWLWTKTRFELAAADNLRDSTINVDVENGVVTLRGSVATAQQKAEAEKVAKSVAGVKAVKNMLTISANTNSSTANTNQKNSNPKKH